MPLVLTDLPRELLEEVYPHVDIPFALRCTCRALRDAFTRPLVELFDERVPGRILGRRFHPHKTKTALHYVVQDVRLLAWACESGCCWHEKLAMVAAAAGREESINYLYEFWEYRLDMQLFPVAAAHGHLATLEWMHQNITARHNCVWSPDTCDAAAEKGHLYCLRFAFDRHFPFSTNGLNMAAQNGHYLCVEFMLTQNLADWRWDRSRCRTCDFAAAGGHIRVLKLLREYALPWCSDTATMCAKHGHLECLEWLQEQTCPLDYGWCFREAAINGHVHIVRWLMARWQPEDGDEYFDEDLLEGVAGNGDEAMAVLELAKELGTRFDDKADLVSIAAQFGELRCAKWLVEQGAPIDPEALPACAATGGHLDVLDWVGALPDVFWGNDTFDGAIQSHHVHVLEWAYNTKKVDGPWFEDCLARRVAKWGNLDMGMWLVDNGFTWGEIATRTNRKMATALSKYLDDE